MATTTRKTRKAATTQPKAGAKRTTTRTTKSSTAKATAKKSTTAPSEPKVKKSDLPEEERDWTYLAEKDPTDLHTDMAQWIEEITGIEADLKTVQAVCVLRMVYQRSERNKNRAQYRGLDETVVAQRSSHMIQAHKDAKEIRERQQAEAERKQAAAKQRRTAKRTPAKKA